MHSNPSAFFLVKTEGGQSQTAPLDKYEEFYANVPASSQTIAFFDPSALPTNPGWPLRNLLAYLHVLYPKATTLRVLCWRDGEVPTAGHSWKSRFGVVSLLPAAETSTARPTAVGWEKNPQGKLGARAADLAPMMDPTRSLAESDVAVSTY